MNHTECLLPQSPTQADVKPVESFQLGEGYTLEWNTSTMVTVSRYGIAYKTVVIQETLDRRRLAVELVVECGVKKSYLAEALHVSRQSIDNWLGSFKKAGFEGLLNSSKGGQEEHAKRPSGNKARELEAERRQAREHAQQQQLAIGFDKADECGDERDSGEVFNETYEFHENRYAGGFLYWGMFQHRFDFMELCESFYGKFSIVVYLFAMMLVHGLRSVEQLKTVFKGEFGRVVGMTRLWSKPLLWKLIHGACALKSSWSFLRGFFHRQARKGCVALGWLYVDGHFVPYYGKAPVHKGYYTQRALMMPGQTEMYVHDVCGQIVYIDIQEGKGDIKEMMRRMSEEWEAYLGGTSPLIIVDREGWGVEHFISLAGTRFVTWEKFSDAEELVAIPDDWFGAAFTVNTTIYQVYEQEKAYHDNRGHCISLRRIVIWNTRTDTRSACVAPVDVDEDAVTIASAMLGRWGCSENSFKWMGSRWNMHYNPLLDASEKSENQEIPNPEHRRLDKEFKHLKNRLAACERQLGRMPLTTNQDGSVRKSKKRDRLQQEHVELKEQIPAVKKMLEACPERIRREETDSGQPFRVLSVEGKNLWNVAQTLVWNSRKQLLDILSMYLPNIRDQIPVLEAMTQGRGWVRSTLEVIEVRLEPLETPRFQAAQIQLCRALNDMEIRLSNGKRLLYDVGSEPESVKKNDS